MKSAIGPLRINLTRVVIVRALEAALVSGLAFYIGRLIALEFHGGTAMVGAWWAAMSGLIVLEGKAAEVAGFALRQVGGNFIGATVGGLGLLFFPHDIPALGLVVLLIVLCCNVLGMSRQAGLASAAAIVICGVSLMSSEIPPLLNAFLRFVESAIGLSLAVAVVFAVRLAERALFGASHR